MVVVGVLALGLTALPGPAQAANVGGGAVTGSVSFSAPGVPPAGQTCIATLFTLKGASHAAVLNTALSAFVGPVSFDGHGGSACENASSGTGTLTLTAQGTGPTESRLSCPTLSGIYLRAGAHVTAVLSGNCSINGLPSMVNFAATVEFHPDTPGAGVTTNVMTATFAGDFVVAPA